MSSYRGKRQVGAFTLGTLIEVKHLSVQQLESQMQLLNPVIDGLVAGMNDHQLLYNQYLYKEENSVSLGGKIDRE